MRYEEDDFKEHGSVGNPYHDRADTINIVTICRHCHGGASGRAGDCVGKRDYNDYLAGGKHLISHWRGGACACFQSYRQQE